MIELALIKWLHIVSATLLFGTGLGSAFYKWRADKSGDLHAIVITNRNVVLADWLFTSPTVILQPVTGVYLAILHAYSWSTPWLMWSIILFVFAGGCWLPVVYLQIKMRNLAAQCLESGDSLPSEYYQMARTWFRLGVPAFIAILLVFALMVGKPVL